jgi:hypothetical protein
VPSLEQFVSARSDERRLHIALTRLGRRGLHIGTVYDIGAHRGDWTEAVGPSLPGARFILFEANDAHADALKQSGRRHFIAILTRRTSSSTSTPRAVPETPTTVR